MSSEEYSYPFFDEDKKVICQICGKPFQIISPKHLTKHNLRYAEYKLRFPDAPLSNSEFAASSKYGKYKDMFNDDDEVVVEDEIDSIEKEFEGMEDPEIAEEIDIGKLAKTIRVYKDPMQAKKSKILDHLRTFFSNIQQDYMIKLIDGGGKLHHEFITDYADPVLKINIEFPDVFWHNQGIIDLNRDEKIQRYGWKVIKISGNNPTPSKVTEIISKRL